MMKSKYLVGLALAISTVAPILTVVSQTIFGGGLATALVNFLSAGLIFSLFADLDKRDNAIESPATPAIEKGLLLTFGVLSLVSLLPMLASRSIALGSLTVASFWAFMAYSAYLGNLFWLRTGLQIVVVVTLLMAVSAMIFKEVAFYMGDFGYSSIGDIVISSGLSLIIYLVICVVAAKKMKLSFAEFIFGKNSVIRESDTGT
jgi:hypothetical protein